MAILNANCNAHLMLRKKCVAKNTFHSELEQSKGSIMTAKRSFCHFPSVKQKVSVKDGGQLFMSLVMHGHAQKPV